MHRLRWLAVPAVFLVALWVYPRPFLSPLGTYLVRADEPEKCDCLFVLAGDFNGQRIMKAAELYRQGLAGKIFVSGPAFRIYGRTEDEMAIEFARANGESDVPFTGMKNAGRSTLSEARDTYGQLRAEGCRSVLAVTSDFHTRRAGNILRREWADMTVRMAAAPTSEYDAERWWQDRSYQKTFFFEWTKTFADWLGL